MIISLRAVEQLIDRLDESDKAISGTVSRDKVMTAQTSLFMNLGLRNKELIKQGIATFASVKGNYVSATVDLVAQYHGNRIDYSTAMSRFRSLTGNFYQQAFRAGAMATGNPYYADPKVGLTRHDLAFISKARRYEATFFRRFLADVKNPNHVPRHGYLKRATYYGESGKAQFFNGMVNGAGENVEIHWVMGAVEEHCSDCPVLASRVYTWKTLPTTPGAGDTACLFNCQCHLEFHERKSGEDPANTFTPGMPGSATPQSAAQPSRYCHLYDTQGQEVAGEAARQMDYLFARMNKARQMIRITEGPLKRGWIDSRRNANHLIIELAKKNKWRAVPEIPVRRLIEVIDRAAAQGVGGYVPHPQLRTGMEVVVVRGDTTLVGVVNRIGDSIFVNTSKGASWRLEGESDIVFDLNKASESKRAHIIEPAKKSYKAHDQVDTPHGHDIDSPEWTKALGDNEDAVEMSANLTNDEVEAVAEYGSTGYTAINNYLREGTLPSLDPDDIVSLTPEGLRKYILDLDKAMAKSRTREDLILFRVAREPSPDMRVGAQFIDRGFFSSSTQRAGTEIFKESTKWELTVLVPKGTPGISMPKVAPWSVTVASEAEILLTRDIEWRIIAVDRELGKATIELVKVHAPRGIDL